MREPQAVLEGPGNSLRHHHSERLFRFDPECPTCLSSSLYTSTWTQWRRYRAGVPLAQVYLPEFSWRTEASFFYISKLLALCYSLMYFGICILKSTQYELATAFGICELSALKNSSAHESLSLVKDFRKY